jgi:uncharacterized membrane protein YadS
MSSPGGQWGGFTGRCAGRRDRIRFTIEHPFRLESHSLAKLLLQASVVALGFGMNLKQVVHAGRSGFVYTAVSISCAMLLGLLFGSLFKMAGKASFLISAGTAICGGSAIAAISPSPEQTRKTSASPWVPSSCSIR